MVKANEIKIGNWIELKNSGVIDVTADNISDIVNNPTIFNPVPITPEIIERFDKDQIARCGGFFTMIQVNGRWCIGKIDNGIDVEYLHQFQNIFRDYTGEELIIKELQTAT